MEPPKPDGSLEPPKLGGNCSIPVEQYYFDPSVEWGARKRKEGASYRVALNDGEHYLWIRKGNRHSMWWHKCGPFKGNHMTGGGTECDLSVCEVCRLYQEELERK